MKPRPLVFLIHGDWGSGKSRFAQTGPAPRLVLDAEGGAEYAFGRKIVWHDPREGPPAVGSWDTCILPVTELRTVQRAFDWLKRGKHPFQSVVIDSLSEIQKRIVDEVAGTEQMQQQDWGTVFRRGEAAVRSFRDLKTNPAKVVPCVVFVAGTVERGRAEVREQPYVQGQLGLTLPGFADVVGLIREEEDGTRRLWVKPQRGTVTFGEGKNAQTVPWSSVAKDRTGVFVEGSLDVTFDRDDSGNEKWRCTIENMMARVAKELAKRETLASHQTAPEGEKGAGK